VIGSHTHVPQGYEIYKESPILYSLGNFLFPWPFPSTNEFWYRGIAVKLTFKNSKVAALDITPICSDKNSGILQVMTSPELEKFLRYYAELCSLIKDDRQIRDLWLGWCAQRGNSLWLNRFKGIPICEFPKTKEQFLKFAEYENLIHCESHLELGLTYLHMIRHKTLSLARKHIFEVEKIIKGYL